MDAAKKKTETVQKARRHPSSNMFQGPSRLLTALESWRNALGISREKFAVLMLDVSASTYERWMRGNFNPRYKDIVRYEALLADSGLIPTRLDGKSDPILAELWENPLDASYDDL